MGGVPYAAVIILNVPRFLASADCLGYLCVWQFKEASNYLYLFLVICYIWLVIIFGFNYIF